MAEYINRADAHKVIIDNSYIDDMLKDLYDLPAADVAEVRHGRWMPWKYKGMGLLPVSGYQCSRCGVIMDGIEDTPTAYHLHYCPNCGAKMDESEDEK